EHLFCAHLEDHIRMGAHPDAARRDFTQKCVELGAVASLMDWIDPDEHSIKRNELCAHGVKDIILVDRRFRRDADPGERSEDGFEAAGFWRNAAARRFITSPEDSDAAEASFGLRHGKKLHVYAPMSAFLSPSASSSGR